VSHESIFADLGIRPNVDFANFGFPVFGDISFPGSGIEAPFLFAGETFAPRIDFFSVLPTDIGGVADPPVLTTPVFERPGVGGTPNIPPPALDPVSIFDDIVSVFSGPSDINTGGIFDVLIGGAGEIFRRQTTTAEERVASGDFFEGDIARAIGNIGGEIAGLEGLGDLIGTGLTVFNQQLPAPFQQQQGVQQVATQIAPCPVGGGSAGFPAGQCVTIGDWQGMGGPKGFEVAGVSAGGTLILRKKRRRRRRGGLTKGMMTDVDYLARKLGKPAAETYLNRVL